MKSTVLTTCYKCSRQFSISYYQIINTSNSPAHKTAILDGTLFSYSCPNCGTKSQVNTPVIYHDPSKKLMIKKEVRGIDISGAINQEIASVSPQVLKTYQLRIVDSWNQLREKVKIFDTQLNDDLLEMIKVKIIGDKLDGQSKGIEILFLEITKKFLQSDQILFQILNSLSSAQSCSISLSGYKNIAAEVAQEMGSNFGSGEWRESNVIKTLSNQ